MPKFKFVAMVNAAPGRDAEFNEWHSKVHMPEVLAASGFKSGQRLKLSVPNGADKSPFQYIIIYEGECADTTKALDALFKAVGEGKVGMSDTLAPENWMAVYEEIPGGSI
jgi:hypothetical protein